MHRITQPRRTTQHKLSTPLVEKNTNDSTACNMFQLDSSVSTGITNTTVTPKKRVRDEIEKEVAEILIQLPQIIKNSEHTETKRPKLEHDASAIQTHNNTLQHNDSILYKPLSNLKRTHQRDRNKVKEYYLKHIEFLSQLTLTQAINYIVEAVGVSKYTTRIAINELNAEFNNTLLRPRLQVDREGIKKYCIEHQKHFTGLFQTAAITELMEKFNISALTARDIIVDLNNEGLLIIPCNQTK